MSRMISVLAIRWRCGMGIGLHASLRGFPRRRCGARCWRIFTQASASRTSPRVFMPEWRLHSSALRNWRAKLRESGKWLSLAAACTIGVSRGCCARGWRRKDSRSSARASESRRWRVELWAGGGGGGETGNAFLTRPTNSGGSMTFAKRTSIGRSRSHPYSS